MISTLPLLPQVDTILPYCLVCADPTGPSIRTRNGSIVDPSVEGNTWFATPKGILQREIFAVMRNTSQVNTLHFVPGDTLGATAHLYGSTAVGKDGTVRGFILNAMNVTASVNGVCPDIFIYKTIFPKTLSHATIQGLVESDFEKEKGSVAAGTSFKCPPMSITSFKCSDKYIEILR